MMDLQTRDFQYFKQQIIEGDGIGVSNSLMPEYLEMIIDGQEEYRPIHEACRRGFVEIARLLIQCQCLIDSKSNGDLQPIHLACKEGHMEIVQLLIEYHCDIECETEEEYRPIHLACQNGHYEIVRLLIDNHCNIESETYEKHRPIHLACIYGHVSIAQLLIEHQCNIESESFNKQRPIHLSCVNGHVDLVKLLIENGCEMESTASIMKYRSIHLACVNGHLDVSQFLIDSQCNIESESFNKYRPIHLACEIGNFDIVKLLISHNCDINCETINQYRPLHLASMKGHLNIVKLLVQNKCETHCESQNGCLPQDLAEKAGHTAIVEFLNAIDSTREILDCIRRNSNLKIEKLRKYFSIDYPGDQNNDSPSPRTPTLYKADGIMKYVLEGRVEGSEISELIDAIDGVQNREIDRLLHECLFFRCITDHHQAGFRLLCSPDIINGRRDIVSQSFLELVAERGCYAFIDDVLRRTIYDKEVWNNASTKALENGHRTIAKTIHERETLIQSRKEADLTILHTAVLDNDSEMVRYVVANGLVDPNKNHQVFGTALALAHSLSYRQCIEVLEQLEVDPDTKNQYSQTPLHEAIASGMSDHCAYLITRSIDIDASGFMGFTALQKAVMRGLEQVCVQLVDYGADCNRYVDIPLDFLQNASESSIKKSFIALTSKENVLTLCIKTQGTIYRCLINQLDEDKANSCDAIGNSLLYMAAKCLKPDICKSLLMAGAVVGKPNANGNNCLLELLSSSDHETCPNALIDIVSILIEFGTDINTRSIDGSTSFQLASRFVNERLMLALVTNWTGSLDSVTDNDFQMPFARYWFNYGEVLLNLLPDDFVSQSITSELILSILSSASAKLLNSLFERTTIDIKQSIVEDLLYRAAQMGDEMFFDSLLATVEIQSPKLYANGETLLTNLMLDNKMRFCVGLFQSRNHKHFVNLRNRRHQIPLQIAIDTGAMDIVDHLIFESEQLDNEDEKGNTALSLMFDKISNIDDANIELKLLSSIKSIISRGANIYKTTSRHRQVIECCLNAGLRDDIESFHKQERDKFDKSALERGLSVENVVIEKLVEVEKICNVCIERVVNCVIECGHTFCMDCGNGFDQCPFCKYEPTNPKRIFFN